MIRGVPALYRTMVGPLRTHTAKEILRVRLSSGALTDKVSGETRP